MMVGLGLIVALPMAVLTITPKGRTRIRELAWAISGNRDEYNAELSSFIALLRPETTESDVRKMLKAFSHLLLHEESDVLWRIATPSALMADNWVSWLKFSSAGPLVSVKLGTTDSIGGTTRPAGMPSDRCFSVVRLDCELP
jgi:hypothetical protein